MSKALIVVDVQRDFCHGGSLAVDGGITVAQVVYDLLNGLNGRERFGWKKVVATRDWHNPMTENGGHFADEPDYVNTWPRHCVMGTMGANFAQGLRPEMFDDVFHKGWNAPAYSGFEGKSMHNNTTLLGNYLGFYDIDEVDICGIATDYCVKATALDALKRNFKTNVIADLTVAVGDKQAALDEMKEAGANIV